MVNGDIFQGQGDFHNQGLSLAYSGTLALDSPNLRAAHTLDIYGIREVQSAGTINRLLEHPNRDADPPTSLFCMPLPLSSLETGNLRRALMASPLFG